MTQFNIGDRVKVIDQEICGTIIRYGSFTELIILDDDDSWQEEGEEPTLTYTESELILIKPYHPHQP